MPSHFSLIEELNTNCSTSKTVPLQWRLELGAGYKMGDCKKTHFHCLSYELEKENIMH